MAQAQTVPGALQGQGVEMVSSFVETVSIPRAIWVATTGIILAVIGGTWDFAWHMSIGRDAFWTPAHMLIWMEGILVGMACAYTIGTTTFAGSSSAREASVRALGIYAPAGVFIAAVGSIMIIASQPFDNWWHNAYGLDSRIVTPPHMVAALGSLATKTGALAWMASIINRSPQVLHERLTRPFLVVGGICVAQLSIVIVNETWMQNLHSARCYLAVALAIPSMLIATGWGSARKWGCTLTASVTMGLGLASEWLLPLFPAQPKLGPVYHNITHLIPLKFPLLLIVPAFVADLLLQRLTQRSSWIKALWIGPAFVLCFMAAEWPFANFLMSPASRNWIFGTAYFSYMDPAGVLYDPYKFKVVEKTLAAFLLTMASALVASVITTRVGLAWGDWMRRVRR